MSCVIEYRRSEMRIFVFISEGADEGREEMWVGSEFTERGAILFRRSDLFLPATFQLLRGDLSFDDFLSLEHINRPLKKFKIA